MTVSSIVTVQALIKEDPGIDSVWEYTNKMNNKVMFAIFFASQICDIHQSPSVKKPVLIWTGGKFIGKYASLNQPTQIES